MSSIACVPVCDQDIEFFFCAEQYLDPKEVNSHFSSTSTRRVAGQLAEAVPQGSHPISDPEHCAEEAVVRAAERAASPQAPEGHPQGKATAAQDRVADERVRI